MFNLLKYLSKIHNKNFQVFYLAKYTKIVWTVFISSLNNPYVKTLFGTEKFIIYKSQKVIQ